jgi:hypothetical protein
MRFESAKTPVPNFGLSFVINDNTWTEGDAASLVAVRGGALASG